MIRQDKTRQDKTNQHNTTQKDNTVQKTRQHQTRQNKPELHIKQTLPSFCPDREMKNLRSGVNAAATTTAAY
jgi:hypothetical protein